MRYFLILLLLTSCSYSVSENSICTGYKPIFRCSSGASTIAMCDTKEECNKICSEKNK